jgi:hypothetical protein
MKREIIFNSLDTMTRDELRSLAKNLNVPRGRNRNDTLLNLTHAIRTGTARFKTVFTISANPPQGSTYGPKLFEKKLRSYKADKVTFIGHTFTVPA